MEDLLMTLEKFTITQKGNTPSSGLAEDEALF